MEKMNTNFTIDNHDSFFMVFLLNMRVNALLYGLEEKWTGDEAEKN